MVTGTVLIMFVPVRNGILRWGTPDPEGDWIMYGHLVEYGKKVVLIDPPLVPGLIDAAGRTGKVEAVILTTLDHTRGSRYISLKTGAALYVPDQGVSMALDPDVILNYHGIKEYEKYGEGDLFGLKVHRVTVEGSGESGMPWFDEYAFLTEEKELIVGDIAIGTAEGKVVMAPEWFPHDPPHEAHEPAHREFRKLIGKTGANTQLAPHGHNIYGDLQQSLSYI